MRSRAERRTASIVAAGAAGILHSTLPFVAVFLTGEVRQPPWTASPASIVEFYRASSFDGRFITGAATTALAFVLLLVFLAKVADAVVDADDKAQWLARLVLAGAALDTAMVLAYLATFVSAVFGASRGGLSPEGYLLLHDVRFALYWLTLITLPVWMVPLGVATIRTGILPRWLGWAMLATAGFMAVALFLPVVAWDAASGLALLWILIAAVVMLARPAGFTRGAEGG